MSIQKELDTEYVYSVYFIQMIKAVVIASILVLIHSWYPSDCCEEGHCEPVPCTSISELSNGDVSWNGINFPKILVRPSQDKDCHVCYNHNSKQPYCVFLRFGV
jgi:hypothetical protein